MNNSKNTKKLLCIKVLYVTIYTPKQHKAGLLRFIVTLNNNPANITVYNLNGAHSVKHNLHSIFIQKGLFPCVKSMRVDHSFFRRL